MSNLIDDIEFVETRAGSIQVTLKITFNESGMARIHGETKPWVMRNDGQVIWNIVDIVREARRLVNA